MVTCIVLGGNKRRERGNAVQASVTPKSKTLSRQGMQQLQRNKEQAPAKLCKAKVYMVGRRLAAAVLNLRDTNQETKILGGDEVTQRYFRRDLNRPRSSH